MLGNLHFVTLIQRIASRIADFWGDDSWFIRRMVPVYEFVLSWISKGDEIPWPINGVTYYVNPHCCIQFSHRYESQVAEFLSRRVKPGEVLLDVGANVGVYVLQFAHWSRPTGQIIAFEPNPSACTVLQRHIQANGLTERVKVVPVALGREKGEAVLYRVGADGVSRLGVPNEALADRAVPVRVPVITLDEYCEAEGLMPDWLLIDVEGFEFHVLAGGKDSIRKRGRSLGIIVEMHPSLWASAATTRDQVEVLLAEFGCRAVPLTGQQDPLGDYGLVYLEYQGS